MSRTDHESDDPRDLSDWVIRNVSLKDVRLSKLTAELKDAAPALPLDTTAALVGTRYDHLPTLAVYYLSYEFSAKDAKKRTVWEASFTLTVSFTVADNVDVEMTDRALQAFGAVGVVEIAHPYVRELLHHVTGRMNVPAFVLEVIPPSWERTHRQPPTKR